MEFIADPGLVNVISLFEFFDNALADVTEGSNIIGKNLYLYWHKSSWLSSNNLTPLYLPFLSKS